jgi:hypothetical protein
VGAAASKSVIDELSEESHAQIICKTLHKVKAFAYELGRTMKAKVAGLPREIAAALA